MTALDVGELSAIDAKLRSAEENIAGMDMPELAETVGEARSRLGVGDTANFRRLVSQAVARLGHLK